MKKRIAGSMGLLIALTVLVFAALWGLMFSGLFGSQVIDGLRTLRVSIIDQTGTVIFDNMANPADMENHLDRPEVADALQNGSGESERFSETLGETTRYYAARLADGNILRLALTTDSLTRFMRAFIPLVIICLALAALLAFIAARRLTKWITTPINEIDLDMPELTEYDELLPLVKKIGQQKREINAQIIALQNRAATIEDITGHMREGLLLLDRGGTVLTANKSVTELFGDVIGRNILSVCRDIEFQQGMKQCLSGGNAEVFFERGDKIYSVHFNPAHNEAGGAVILFFDVTARHESEKQRREFSANVSHELKTPLTGISAYAELIENGMAKEEDVKGFAARISEQAKRLFDIINDIIKLSEFDEGGIQKEFVPFDLYELAESAADALRDNRKNVEIRLTGERFGISANRRMIDELLYNLIDNGIKYNHDGGSVTVALSLEDGLCKIAVSDTGIGIPAEHHNHIFERFYRVDKSRSKKTGGTGLGLSIVKHIAEHHGGRVELKSAEGEGTAVTCWIAAGV